MLAEIVIILVLVLLNGVFSGAEIAILTVRKTRLDDLVEEKRPGASAVRALRAQPERFLATVQIGITVVGTTAAAFGGEAVAERLMPMLAKVPTVAPYASGLSLALVVVPVSYVSLVLGELVPKSLALRWAERYALLAAPGLRLLAQVARPLVWLLTASSNVLLRLFGDRTSFTEARLSPEELQELVEDAGKVGSLDPRVAEMASRALDMRDLKVSALMIPRESIVSLSIDIGREELVRALERRRHTRVPVFRGDPHNVVGYVALTDLLVPAFRGEPIVLADLVRPVYFASEGMLATKLLSEMRQQRTPIAVVLDGSGDLTGLVTMQDLAEEVIGEIVSEDKPAHQDLIRMDADGSALVAGAMPTREVNRALGLELPEGEHFTTIGGLAVELGGRRIPKPGARLVAPGGAEIHVVTASDRRVHTVRLRKPRSTD